MSTDNNQMEILESDVLADLEGDEGGEFSAGGMEPGVYDARIQDITYRKKTLIARKGEHEGEEFEITEAVFDLELTGDKYNGWTRNHNIQIGKVGGQLRDNVFRGSVRRVVGEEVYREQIRTLPLLADQYSKSFELLKGMECRVTFARPKGKEDDATATAWPRGGLLAPVVVDESDTNLI